MGRYELTDGEWKAIEPHLPNKPRGVPPVDDRPPEISDSVREVVLGVFKIRGQSAKPCSYRPARLARRARGAEFEPCRRSRDRRRCKEYEE